ncbi:M20/M25/M40 family metallo-hydrolase [Mycolicibacterium lutetiense]
MSRRLSGVLAFVILLAVVVGTTWEQQPRGHRDASAPTGMFSAERALDTVKTIASRPHPVGSAEHDRVREHLADQLRNLGLDTEIRYGVGRYPAQLKHDVVGMARVGNIVAHQPGRDSTGTVYLMAHYDSVPSGPGANDDGVGVATIVEAVRALHASATILRNDLVIVLTDAEELGLLGAEAFVASGGADPRGGVVVNHEARGAGGPPLMWRTSRPTSTLLGVVGAAPHPNTDSLTTTLAGAQTGSNTDFAALDRSGLTVLDWAFVGRNAYYHNPFDDPSHVNLATVQQFGDNTVALARDFGQRDLGTSEEDNSAYFTLPFGVLVVLPLWVISVLAVTAVLVAGWVMWRMRRNGEASIVRSLGSAATAVLSIPVSMAAVYGLWEAIIAIRPQYRSLFVDPYRPEFYYAAVIVLCMAVLATWYALSRRWFGASATVAGLLCSVAVIGAVATAIAPAAAVVVVIPAFAAALGVSLTFVVPDPWRLPVLTILLVPGAVMLGTMAFAGLQAGISGAPYLTAPAVMLLGVLLLPTLTHAWPSRRIAIIPSAALVLTAALAAAGLAVDRFDDRHPLMSQLSYVLDADHHEAQWVSQQRPDHWTRRFLEPRPPQAQFAGLWPEAVASGSAPVRALSAPSAEVLFDTTDSVRRTIGLQLRSTRGANSIAVRYGSPPQALRVSGRDITPVPRQGFQFSAVPAEGIEVQLTIPAGPLEVRVIDYSWLPDAHLADPPADIFYRQDSTVAVFMTVTEP